jgi:hypothetical protein
MSKKFVTADERLARGGQTKHERLDIHIVRPAIERGDWEEIAQHLDQGGEINTPALRELFIQLLRKTAKRAANRPPTKSTAEFHDAIASYVLEAESTMGDAKARKAAMKHFGVSYSTVSRAMAQARFKIEATRESY